MAETTTTIENGQGDCCICCKAGTKTCYCGCCPCVPTSDLTFSVLDCYVTVGGVSQPCGACADSWTFTLTKQDTECIVHTVGDIDGQGTISCTPCANEYDDHLSDPYPEAWGFSGTVCGGTLDCSTTDPPFESASCGGMALRASLCCCKTGIPETEEYTTDEHPCPMVTASNCNGSHQMEDAPCSMDCFWFGMSTWEKYDIDSTPGNDSPCSPCAAVQPAFGPVIPGSLFGGGAGTCFTIVSGQCQSSTTPNKPFMLAVRGQFMIACDCQTGLVGYGFGGVVTSYSPVQMTIDALIHE